MALPSPAAPRSEICSLFRVEGRSCRVPRLLAPRRAKQVLPVPCLPVDGAGRGGEGSVGGGARSVPGS